MSASDALELKSPPLDAKTRAQALTHDDLNRMAVRWLRNQGYTAFAECGTQYATERADAIGWTHRGTSILIECKRTVADFKADKAKTVRTLTDLGFGQFRYFLCPAGLLKPDDMPEKWGLLWAYPSRVMEQKRPTMFDAAKAASAEKRLLTALLQRMYNDLCTVHEETKRELPARYR